MLPKTVSNPQSATSAVHSPRVLNSKNCDPVRKCVEVSPNRGRARRIASEGKWCASCITSRHGFWARGIFVTAAGWKILVWLWRCIFVGRKSIIKKNIQYILWISKSLSCVSWHTMQRGWGLSIPYLLSIVKLTWKISIYLPVLVTLLTMFFKWVIVLFCADFICSSRYLHPKKQLAQIHQSLISFYNNKLYICKGNTLKKEVWTRIWQRFLQTWHKNIIKRYLLCKK